ncbi:MAG: hypothetical protein GVY10_04870 [Verrucomicrobia bacterium]|jgi:hypothetical protein|nr:hypothetical protein [Verrucomicrobiota bacterium]
MISAEASRLMLKANRVLGTRLVESGLVTNEDMDRANELFIELARAKDLRRASLLRILLFENQTLLEESLLDYQLEEFPVGAILLENYQMNHELILQHPLDLLRASWTLPIDLVQGRWFLATAYYMSDPMRAFWEERLNGRITWYICPFGQFETSFEELQPVFDQHLGALTNGEEI